MVSSLSGAIAGSDHVISHDQRLQNSFNDPATSVDFLEIRRLPLCRDPPTRRGPDIEDPHFGDMI